MKRFIFFSLALITFLVGVQMLFFEPKPLAVMAGFSLSFLFTGSNLWFVETSRKWEGRKFSRFFYLSILVRLILVLALFILIIKTTKIHQIYFTVSFIISYILHSVIEIISIHNLIETDN